MVAGMPNITPNTVLDRFTDESNILGTDQLGKFDEIIEKLQQVKNGNDINNMKTAVDGIDKEMEQPATELDERIGQSANFGGQGFLYALQVEAIKMEEHLTTKPRLAMMHYGQRRHRHLASQ